MNIVGTLTLRHLEENKKRTVVTILGIATATALISAIVIGAFSFFQFMGRIIILSDGDSQAAFYEVPEETALDLKNDDRIALAGITDTEPFTSGVRIDSGKEDRFRIGNIGHGDGDFYTETVTSDYEGELPRNSSEIAVEEKFLEENGLDLSIGDTLSFEEGNRYSYDEKGEKEYWAGSYRSGESFETLSNEICTITAVLHGNRPTKGCDILRGMDEKDYPPLKYAQVRIKLKKCDISAVWQIKDIIRDYGITKAELNRDYLLSVFSVDFSSESYVALVMMMCIAILIVVVTSVVLIVNSFGMSLTERIRYLGMLASVGATARQKRSSIFFEGFILGIMGIPLGLLLGFTASKITLSVLGSRILESDMLSGAEGMRGSIPITCSPFVILSVIAISGITIFISALVPAFRASKIMPVDAIRQNDTILVKAKSLKVNPIIRKVFGYEGELAYKNIKRNGIKGTVITASIAVSVIMFLTINFFCDSIERVNKYDFDLPYDIAVSCAYDEKDMLKKDLFGIDGIDRIINAGMISFPFYSADEDKETANKGLLDPLYRTSDYKDLKLEDMCLLITDDKDFKELLERNGLPEEKYFGGELKGVLLNNYFHTEQTEGVFNEGILGQRLYYDKKEGNPPAVEIADFVKYDKESYIFKMIPRESIMVIVPESVYYEKAAGTLGKDLLTADFGIVTPAHDEVYDKIYGLLEEGGYHNFSCSDLTDSLSVMNTVTLILKTIMYGFTIVLTLIAVANIINTISTGILLRRKEFAMYRSVGLARDGFKKLICLETFLYGLRALILGLPVAFILSYLMYRSFDVKLFSFNPDYLMYLCVAAAVFLLVGASMAFSVNRIKDDSIIETLKEDAI